MPPRLRVGLLDSLLQPKASVRGLPLRSAKFIPPRRSVSRSNASATFSSAAGPQKKPWTPFLSAAFALTMFSLGGYQLGLATIAPMPAIPGSEDDKLALKQIESQYEQLDIVQELRQHPEQWKESKAYQAEDGWAEERRKGVLTAGTLANSSALALHRVFFNKATSKAISVVYLGRAVSGWPGVVHGGMLATLLDESLGRVAILSFPAQTGMTAKLTVNYRKPCMAGQFLVVYASLDGPIIEGRKANTKGWIETLDHVVTTEADALFVVPKALQLGKIAGF